MSEDLDIDLGLGKYEAPVGKTARYTFPDLRINGEPLILETRAASRRLNPALASALQRSPRQGRAKSNIPADIAANDEADRRENRALAVEHMVTGWPSGVRNRAGDRVAFSKAAAKVVIDQVPADHFDDFFVWCMNELNFAPVMTAEAAEELAGK